MPRAFRPCWAALRFPGEATFEGTNEIVHNPDLYETPPLGYLESMVMRISPGTWCQVVD